MEVTKCVSEQVKEVFDDAAIHYVNWSKLSCMGQALDHAACLVNCLSPAVAEKEC